MEYTLRSVFVRNIWTVRHSPSLYNIMNSWLYGIIFAAPGWISTCYTLDHIHESNHTKHCKAVGSGKGGVTLGILICQYTVFIQYWRQQTGTVKLPQYYILYVKMRWICFLQSYKVSQRNSASILVMCCGFIPNKKCSKVLQHVRLWYITWYKAPIALQ